MKRLAFLLLALSIGFSAFSQDFSYLKDIELATEEQVEEAREDVTECCYYLIAERYDKKDIQRQQATEFVRKWLTNATNKKELIPESLNEVSEGREDINNMYIACYAMSMMEQEEDQSETILHEKALRGVLDYCLNPAHKVKPTKAMKQLASK
jgi:hypothetical protein